MTESESFLQNFCEHLIIYTLNCLKFIKIWVRPRQKNMKLAQSRDVHLSLFFFFKQWINLDRYKVIDKSSGFMKYKVIDKNSWNRYKFMK